MQAKLVLDQDADVSKAPPEYLKKITYVARKGSKKPVPVYPKGTVFNGDHAIVLVESGQAEPLDPECIAACNLSPDQLAAVQVDYLMTSLGIHDPDDRELYRGGVILGYDKDGKKIPGPGWESYQAAKAELDKEDEI